MKLPVRASVLGAWPVFVQWRQLFVTSSCVFLVVLGVYLADRGVIQSSDARWTLYLTESLIHAGDLNLDEYGQAIAADDYRVTVYGEHVQTRYPIGASLLIAPLAVGADFLVKIVYGIDLYEYLRTKPVSILTLSLDLALASVIIALTAAVVYLIGRQSLSNGKAVMLAFVFAFATSAWSTASRGLWQHGPSMLLLSISLLIVLAAKNRPGVVQWLGPVLVCAYIVRPANLIVAGLFSVYVFAFYRQDFLRFVAWAALLGVPFAAYNLTTYGRILPSYYWPSGLGGNSDMGSALLGTLFSPSRGLLIYSPVFFLAIGGVVLKIRQGRFGALDAVLAAMVVAHWLTISTWAMWWGGTSYGPRLFTDMIPFLMVMMIPVFEQAAFPHTMSGAVVAFAAVLLVVISVAMHYRGATQPETWLWNQAVVGQVAGVDQAPERVWDWSDPQFLRGLDVADMMAPARAY